MLDLAKSIKEIYKKPYDKRKSLPVAESARLQESIGFGGPVNIKLSSQSPALSKSPSDAGSKQDETHLPAIKQTNPDIDPFVNIKKAKDYSENLRQVQRKVL